MGPIEFAGLIALGALWGASFLLIRIGVPDFGPVALVGVRLAIASAIVLGYSRATSQSLPRVQDWRRWLVVGAINTALPFVLFSVAELRVTASLGSILNATTPFFAAVLGAVWLGQRLARGRVAGLAIGLIGVVLVVGWDTGLSSPADYLAALAGLGGGASYAVGTLLVRRLFPHAGSTTLAAGQQTAAACLMIPLGVDRLARGNAGDGCVVGGSWPRCGDDSHRIPDFFLAAGQIRGAGRAVGDVHHPDLWRCLGCGVPWRGVRADAGGWPADHFVRRRAGQRGAPTRPITRVIRYDQFRCAHA